LHRRPWLRDLSRAPACRGRRLWEGLNLHRRSARLSGSTTLCNWLSIRPSGRALRPALRALRQRLLRSSRMRDCRKRKLLRQSCTRRKPLRSLSDDAPPARAAFYSLHGTPLVVPKRGRHRSPDMPPLVTRRLCYAGAQRNMSNRLASRIGSATGLPECAFFRLAIVRTLP
jgi:hypothetical protein